MRIINALALFLLLFVSTAYGVSIPCFIIGEDGKPSGKSVVITPYKEYVEISFNANNKVIVPYYGNADGAGWEYIDSRWDVLVGKSSPSVLSVVVFDSANEFSCDGRMGLK